MKENYKIMRNFLTKEEKNLLKGYCELKHRFNFDNFDPSNVNMDSYFYADYVMESLMICKSKKMSEITGLKLLPTYAFWRMYTYGSDLKKHKDRPSCQYSVTVNISSSGEKWPIFADGTEVNLEPGDGMVYKGCDVLHWREPFKGDYQAQVFLHYVDANDKYAEFARDKRPYYGLPNRGK